MRNPYDKLEESYEGVEYVGDFFNSRIIRSVYARLFKQIGVEEDKYKDFDLENKEHLDFVRHVFENEELSAKFLSILKAYFNKGIKYDTKTIVSFLLVWVDIKDRVCSYSESIASIFSEKVISTLETSGNTIEYEEDDDDIIVRRYSGLNFLLSQEILPVSDNGEVIFGISDFGIDGVYEVVKIDGEIILIDDKGKRLKEQEVNEMLRKQVKDKLERYERSLEYLKNKDKFDSVSEEIRKTISEVTQGLKDGDKEKSDERILKRLKKMIGSCHELLKKGDDLKIFRSNQNKNDSSTSPESPTLH